MNYIIEGFGALVNEKGEEQPLKAGDFALVDPSEKHQYLNKGDVPFKMISGPVVPFCLSNRNGIGDHRYSVQNRYTGLRRGNPWRVQPVSC
jgi:gentisate 1,2-dioxygenase